MMGLWVGWASGVPVSCLRSPLTQPCTQGQWQLRALSQHLLNAGWEEWQLPGTVRGWDGPALPGVMQARGGECPREGMLGRVQPGGHVVGGLPGLSPVAPSSPSRLAWSHTQMRLRKLPREQVLPPPTREVVHQAVCALRRAGLCAAVSRAGPARDTTCRTAAPQRRRAEVAPV